MLGGGYTLLNLLMGGLSHAAGHVGHIGHTLQVPHLPEIAGHVHGHAGATHAAGGAHAGHANTPHSHAVPKGSSHSHGEIEEAGARFNVLAYLNPLAVAGFLLGFGGIGVLTGMLYPGLQPGLRAASGAVAGWFLWLAAYLIATRVFGGAEGTSHNLREQLVGARAEVTVSIVGARPGMVAYTVAGSRQVLRAITEEDDSIPIGAAVRIRRVDGATAHVTRID